MALSLRRPFRRARAKYARCAEGRLCLRLPSPGLRRIVDGLAIRALQVRANNRSDASRVIEVGAEVIVVSLPSAQTAAHPSFGAASRSLARIAGVLHGRSCLAYKDCPAAGVQIGLVHRERFACP
jgi:hypothetical protein